MALQSGTFGAQVRPLARSEDARTLWAAPRGVASRSSRVRLLGELVLLARAASATAAKSASMIVFKGQGFKRVRV